MLVIINYLRFISAEWSLLVLYHYISEELDVAASMNNVLLISCYVSPNVSLIEYRAFLDELTEIITGAQNRLIILAGDFNAHSLHWGSPSTSPKGELLETWAAGLDLRLVNTGDAPTCVRWNGSSVVDLTWASPGLIRRITDWE